MNIVILTTRIFIKKYITVTSSPNVYNCAGCFTRKILLLKISCNRAIIQLLVKMTNYRWRSPIIISRSNSWRAFMKRLAERLFS